MKTLRQISQSSPGTYRVYDNAASRGELRRWEDRIEIHIDGKVKECTRKGAYKYGLCVRAH